MPVEKTDVVDFMSSHPKSKVVSLVMVEHRDWSLEPGAVRQLHEKLNTYAQFILSGGIAAQNPELADHQVCIRLEHFGPMVPQVGEALKQWAGKLADVPAAVVSHRMHWNRLVSVFHRVKEKFGEEGKYDTRWLPDDGDQMPLMTSRQFTQLAAEWWVKVFPDANVRIHQDLELEVARPNGEPINSFLYNAFREYLGNPENAGEIIERYGKILQEAAAGEKKTLDRTYIVPVIKDRAWVADTTKALAAKFPEKAPETVHEDFNDELVVAYAEDTPRTIRYLRPDHIKETGLELQDLRRIACENMKRIMTTPTIEVEGGVYRIKAGGVYDASLLLLDSFWEESKLGVLGDVVVAIPAPGVLFVTGSQDEVGLTALKSLAEKICAQAPHALTSKLFVRRDGRFVPFEARD